MSGVTGAPAQVRSSARSVSSLAARRYWLRMTLRAMPMRYATAGSGSSAIRRQATRNVSLATSSASCRPTRLAA